MAGTLVFDSVRNVSDFAFCIAPLSAAPVAPVAYAIPALLAVSLATFMTASSGSISPLHKATAFLTMEILPPITAPLFAASTPALWATFATSIAVDNSG